MRVEHEMQQSELASMAVVYSLDIGVYFVTRAGQPASRTKAAWARLNHWPGDLAAVRAGARSGTALELTSESGRPIDTDRDLLGLASRLLADLGAQRWVALGFEAPMWFPVYTAGPTPGDPLFPCRCEEERTREWYLQSGAAATLKAIGLGTWLFSLLHDELPDLRFTTEPEEWRRRPERLLLFESFVAGSYKRSPPAGVPHDSWDALLGAAALWATEVAPGAAVGIAARRFEPAIPGDPSIVSVWKVILDQTGYSTTSGSAGACGTYALGPGG